MDAVVFDLFGTLVDAPTPADRSHAARRLATIIGCGPDDVERYLRETWQFRHDGSLATVVELARHLVGSVGGTSAIVDPVAAELHCLGRDRLVPDRSVLRTLASLVRTGLRLGLLSDAGPEIAAAWPASGLATSIDVALFSRGSGYVKPD
jgi:putative hydrolase of the HAD superfamily